MKRAQVFEKIYPDYFIETLQRVGELHSRTHWSIGELTIIAKEELAQAKTDIINGRFEGDSHAVLYILAYLVGDLYRDVAPIFGISVSRLRTIVSVVEFFDQEIIEQYKALPFSHFEFAMRLSNKALEILEFDARQTDRQGGKAPSVEWLYANFTEAINGRAMSDHRAINDFEDAHNTVFENDNAKPDLPGIPPAIYYFLTSSINLVDSVGKSILEMDIDQTRKDKLMHFITTLRELAKAIEADIRVV